jgi:hypothetical protein
MLLSPLQLHADLSRLTSPSPSEPHTALLILPHGRLLCSASKYDEMEFAEDEPYLDEPERLRLLCGLASQWEEDESSRVECEVSGRGCGRARRSCKL